MLSSLFDRLFAAATAPLQDHDARLAITALLVRLARADNDYGAVEVDQITRVISRRYDLSADDTATLLAQTEELEATAPDTVRFTSAVKDAVPLEDRMSVVEAAWMVVLADGVRSAEEDALMRMIPHFLGITDRASNEARLRAAKLLNQS